MAITNRIIPNANEAILGQGYLFVTKKESGKQISYFKTSAAANAVSGTTCAIESLDSAINSTYNVYFLTYDSTDGFEVLSGGAFDEYNSSTGVLTWTTDLTADIAKITSGTLVYFKLNGGSYYSDIAVDGFGALQNSAIDLTGFGELKKDSVTLNFSTESATSESIKSDASVVVGSIITDGNTTASLTAAAYQNDVKFEALRNELDNQDVAGRLLIKDSQKSRLLIVEFDSGKITFNQSSTSGNNSDPEGTSINIALSIGTAYDGTEEAKYRVVQTVKATRAAVAGLIELMQIDAGSKIES